MSRLRESPTLNSETGSNRHPDDVTAELATAWQQLTAIRAQERGAAHKVEALIERKKASARIRLEEATRYAAEVEAACDRVRVELETDHARTKKDSSGQPPSSPDSDYHSCSSAGIDRNEEEKFGGPAAINGLKHIEEVAPPAWREDIKYLVFHQQSERLNLSFTDTQHRSQVTEMTTMREQVELHKGLDRLAEVEGQLEECRNALADQNAKFQQEKENFLRRDKEAQVRIAEVEEQLEEFRALLKVEEALRITADGKARQEESRRILDNNLAVENEIQLRRQLHASEERRKDALAEVNKKTNEISHLKKVVRNLEETISQREQEIERLKISMVVEQTSRSFQQSVSELQTSNLSHAQRVKHLKALMRQRNGHVSQEQNVTTDKERINTDVGAEPMSWDQMVAGVL